MDYNISKFLDKRRNIKESKNRYPVKIRVYSIITKKAKLYATNINLTQDDFDTIFDANSKLHQKKKEIQLYLNEFEKRAHDVAKNLSPFTFDKFEKKLFRNKNAAISVQYYYQEKIKSLKTNQQISTASNYDLSLKSLGMFLLDQVQFDSLEDKIVLINKKLKKLTFYDITPEWLNRYENFMVNQHGKSYTTVSMYLRGLRTIFNIAIDQNDITKEIYPFGKANSKYQIPNSQKKKKALTNEQLSLLFSTKPKTPEQQKAKDFWFLSYALNGMNMKDICLLKYGNISDDRIEYYREKTINTKKSNLKLISVFLNDFCLEVIKKYTLSADKKGLIFPVIEETDDASEQKRKIKNFISFINHYFNKFAISLGFNFKIGSMWARHSFATNAIRKGASMEFISEALSHSNLNVTKEYFAGFEDETKKEFAKNLMNF